MLKGTVSDPQFLPDGEHMASLFAKVAAQVVADVATQKAKDEAKNLLQQKLQNQATPSSVPTPKVDIKQGGKDLKKAFGF